MKLAPLLSAFAVFAVAILAVGLRTQADPPIPPIPSAGIDASVASDAPQPSLDAFVAEVGIDVTTMSTTLRREEFFTARKSLPLCSLSPKRQVSQVSPLEAFAESVGVDVSDFQPAVGERR